MDKKRLIVVVVAVVLLWLLLWPPVRFLVQTNWLVLITVLRGIVSPNCFWWNVNDLFTDTTGVNLYDDLKNWYDGNNVVPINILGTRYYLVTDIELIKIMLDNSPHVFGVGKLKDNFFQTFMKKNLGVSTGCPWQRRRKFNTKVLQTTQLHDFAKVYHQDIRRILQTQGLPKKFDEFAVVAKLITMKVLFGVDDHIHEPIFDIFKHANTISALLFGTIDQQAVRSFQTYITKQLQEPKSNQSLLYLAKKHALHDFQELMDQVPHWIFPIVGGILLSGIRVLILLSNHPRVLRKVLVEIRTHQNPFDSHYLRNCILETFRLNNPVSSTFRTLLQDNFSFGNRRYKKGTQFLMLNNPVLRDPHAFPNPHQFIPERWEQNPELETSYYAVMFNQGPQKCPGKDLIITLLQSFIMNYIVLCKGQFRTNRIDTDYIKQMINPCSVNITFSTRVRTT